MIIGAIATVVCFLLAVLQITHGNDVGAIIFMASSIIFYGLYIVNVKVVVHGNSLREYLKRSESNELS